MAAKYLFFEAGSDGAITYAAENLIGIDQVGDGSIEMKFKNVNGVSNVSDVVTLTVTSASEQAVMKAISEAIAFGKDQFLVVADDDAGSYLHSDITACSVSAGEGGLTPGSGITAGAAFYKSWTQALGGGVVKTSVFIDLTGLASGDNANDIIGDDGGVANSHIGQYTTAKMGTLFAVVMEAKELPAGGDPDINLVFADEATLAENTALSAATNGGTTINSGDLVAGTPVYAHAGFPAVNQYFYLSNGTGDHEAAYTGGNLLIEFYGQK